MEKIKMQPTRPEDALLTDAFADFLEKCRAKNLSEKTLNIYCEAENLLLFRVSEIAGIVFERFLP